MAKNELDEFSRELLALAVDFEKGKQAKKFMKKEAGKLTKKNKQKAKDKDLDKQFDGELMKNFKTGKAKKKNDNVICSSYNNAVIQGDKNGQYYSLGGMLEHGYIHHGGKDKTGKETFIEGTHFMEEARDNFDDEFYNDCQDFIDDMLNNYGLS